MYTPNALFEQRNLIHEQAIAASLQQVDSKEQCGARHDSTAVVWHSIAPADLASPIR